MEKTKTHLTTAYMMFIFDFADPSQAQIDMDIRDLFSSQRNADQAKKKLGKDGFKKALSLYFNKFQTKHGLDFRSLEDEIISNKKVFLRHLGRDKINFLLLITTVMRDIETPVQKKGLLFERATA